MRSKEIPGLIEALDTELDGLMENINDASTRAAVPRELTLKIKIKPSESRTIETVEYVLNSKYAPTVSIPAA